MHLVVTGGRSYADRDFLFRALDAIHARRGIDLLGHGACPVGNGGADWIADDWAQERAIDCKRFPVIKAIDGPWPGAGPSRNRRMLRSMLALVDGDTKRLGVVAFASIPVGNGTASCAAEAAKLGLTVWWPAPLDTTLR